jgi:hypothetical protein
MNIFNNITNFNRKKMQRDDFTKIRWLSDHQKRFKELEDQKRMKELEGQQRIKELEDQKRLSDLEHTKIDE